MRNVISVILYVNYQLTKYSMRNVISVILHVNYQLTRDLFILVTFHKSLKSMSQGSAHNIFKVGMKTGVHLPVYNHYYVCCQGL